MIQVDLNKHDLGTPGTGIALDLTKEDSSLKRLKVLLNWDEHPVHGRSLTDGFDLDLWAICLDQNGKVTAAEQICWYKNRTVFGGAVQLSEDNRTGAGDDDEFMVIDTTKMPSSVGTTAIYVFIHDAPQRGQNFGMVANANVKVFNADDNHLVAQYNITQDFNGETAVCIGNLVGTTFTPDGSSGQLGPNEVLAHYQ